METLADHVEDTAVAREKYTNGLSSCGSLQPTPMRGTAYRRVVVVLPEAPSNVAWSVESDNLDFPERSTDAVGCSEGLRTLPRQTNNYETCLLPRNETGP